LNNKATLLTACVDHVQKALVWLQAHNPLYKHIELDEHMLEQISTCPVLPFSCGTCQSSDAQDVLQSRYNVNLPASGLHTDAMGTSTNHRHQFDVPDSD
jgi:hypothetical protein